MPQLRISFESEDFPPGVATPFGELPITWDDLAWAALTVGRPNRAYVFRHGESSMYEAIFRLSLLRLALEQSGAGSTRLRRTPAAKSLDPTEKGAINYFVGLAVCKLFADRLLGTPWLLHLDVWRAQLGAVLNQRSRPDLVGQNAATGDWIAFECKGRLSPPSEDAKLKAKAQAERIVSVQGQPCTMHVGSVSYFRKDYLQFYWRDPVPSSSATEIELRTETDLWRDYYQPVAEFAEREPVDERGQTTPLAGPDVRVEIHPAIRGLLHRQRWSAAKALATETRAVLHKEGFQSDGLRVVAGPTWGKRYQDEAERLQR